MAKAAKITLPKQWQRFPAAYAKTHNYWYFPKGLAATEHAIRPRLAILRPLNTMSFHDAQKPYIKALNAAGITDAETEWEGGGAPLGRMLVQVLRIIGLAWVNPAGRIEITEAGQQFLSATNPAGILSTQLDRYQFWNPTVRAKIHEDIKVHPIPFLAEVMRTVSPQYISAHEYELFVARARSYAEVDRVVDYIEDFRSLSEEQRNMLYDQCGRYMIGGKKRTSLLNTIRLNRSYAFAAITLSKLFERDSSGLQFRTGALKRYRKFLQRYQADHTFIEYENVPDWMAYFGDPSAEPTLEAALDYYVGRGDVQKALALKQTQGVSKAELKEFREMVVSETRLEDYLEENLDYIGKPTGYDLVLVGRQYKTGVGRVDLLCKDKKSGDYVVIELKKGRSADKVYGQCSRYMGWVRKNLADPQLVKVHGAIVARRIDTKLKAARDAHDTKVHLIEFEMKIGATAV